MTRKTIRLVRQVVGVVEDWALACLCIAGAAVWIVNCDSLLRMWAR